MEVNKVVKEYFLSYVTMKNVQILHIGVTLDVIFLLNFLVPRPVFF